MTISTPAPKPRPLDQQLSLADMLTLQTQQHQRAQQVDTPNSSKPSLIGTDNWQPELGHYGYRPPFEPMA